MGVGSAIRWVSGILSVDRYTIELFVIHCLLKEMVVLTRTAFCLLECF